MKGIVVTKDQFDSLPVSYQDRVIIKILDDGMIALFKTDEEFFGRIICKLMNEPKIPVFTDKEFKFVYPKWKGDVIE